MNKSEKHYLSLLNTNSPYGAFGKPPQEQPLYRRKYDNTHILLKLAEMSSRFDSTMICESKEDGVCEAVFQIRENHYCLYCKDRQLVKINRHTYHPGKRMLCSTLILGNITVESFAAWANAKLTEKKL